MIRKELVPGSFSKNWEEQQELLIKGVEITPNVAEVAWCVTAYKAIRGVYLLWTFYVRTSSLDSEGRPVYLGCFTDEGLFVGSEWDYARDFHFGVSSRRK